MKKLLKAFKSLPREIKMMIAMAGLGSPIGAIYLLRRFFFPKTSLFFIIIGVAIVIAVLAVIGLIIAKIFGRGKRKRSNRMAGELAAESAGGPVSMDVGAAIKANNEKFFGAIREMRKNVGISVYDLPWYIIIGDSGCGKTKLINEGGLQFSTGKPEGYQLGTLNYNWWFTEDAVFVDMAGRLCNPRDDADRREWEAFLNTIGKGRKGFPINGTILCVSADHLLADPPEKVEEYANTALERLRDLQTKLGVTFATYLVVTKCDKIVGFMQFFDRAERDITVLNQMFGWSKPGAFTDLYDPEGFPGDFDEVYRRLYELRLRRLNDEADEIDLGLAYSFPEEFRELRDPLQTYVRTLFPKIKNPRAIKNLIYRGLYFTSATREGALILKHITERLGPTAAEQFSPLDLYPSKRPYFIKDLLFRKVFPEHGLVFRNEQDLVRNRKLAKLLKFGSAVMAVVLIALVVTGTLMFEGIIGEPRAAAEETKPYEEPLAPEALRLAGKLEAGIGTLRDNIFWARLISLWSDPREPMEDLSVIQAALFERVPLRSALVDVSKALREGPRRAPAGGEAALEAGNEYLSVFKEYVAWYGCIDGESTLSHTTYDSFATLCGIVTDEESPIIRQKEDFFAQAKNYFTVLKELGEWKTPARLLNDEAIDPRGTILAALKHVHGHLAKYATLSDQNPDADIREWMRIREQCALIDETYGRMLGSSAERPDTLEKLDALKAGFLEDFNQFSTAIDALQWQSAELLVKIPGLRDAILRQRKDVWLNYEETIQEAYKACQISADADVSYALGRLSEGHPELKLLGVDRVLWNSLRNNDLTDKAYSVEYFEPESFARAVTEVEDPYAHIFRLITESESASDRLEPTKDLQAVHAMLAALKTALVEADFDPPAKPGAPADWLGEMDVLFDEPPSDPDAARSLESLDPIWQPEALAALRLDMEDDIRRGKGRRLLRTMEGALANVGTWGIAELLPDKFDKKRSAYRITTPRQDQEDESRGHKAKERDDKPRSRREPRSRGPKRGRRPKPARGGERIAATHGDGQVPFCAKRDFLFDRGWDCALLLYNLRFFDEKLYLPSADDDGPLNVVCTGLIQDAGEAYMRTYVNQWSQAYDRQGLSELARLMELGDEWTTLAENVKRRGEGTRGSRGTVSDEMHSAVVEILAAVPFWGWSPDEDTGEWFRASEGGDAEWLEVVSWMQEAIESQWPPQLGQFAGEAMLPVDELGQHLRREDAPWTALADEFRRRWKKLTTGIADNARLPRKFSTIPSARERKKRTIPWGKIEKLRAAARLDDEKLTQQLVDFERKAQRLLSAEITDILVGIQDRYFKRQEPWDGWPYLGSRGDESDAFKTVDFEKFASFVAEVGFAQRFFDPLEVGLSEDDEFLSTRKEFYRLCRDWSAFLDLDRLTPAPLRVDVDWEDPLSMKTATDVQVDDTAQMYYGKVELDLGLAWEEGGAVTETPLLVGTDPLAATSPPPAQWKWPRDVSDRGILFRLTDGARLDGQDMPMVEKRLGTSSPLAFCAYLHRYGKGSNRQWVTTHSVDLPARLRKKGKAPMAVNVERTGNRLFGLGFKFELERPMPPPIPKLGGAGSRRHGG